MKVSDSGGMLARVSDVVLTALITGGVGVVGNVVQYLSTRRQTGVEVQKIKAEDARAHAARVEDARQARRTTYQRLLTVLHDLDRLSTSDAPMPGESERLGNEFLEVHTAVLLDAPVAVTNAMDPVTAVLSEIQQDASKQYTDPFDVIAFQRAYRKRNGDVVAAKAELLSAIYDDVTKPLLPDTAP